LAENDLLPTLSWQNRAKGLASNLINFVFPPRCASCNTIGFLLCMDCYGRIQWIKEPICPKCGRVLADKKPLCHVCQIRPLPLKQIRAATLFEDPISQTIHNFKYNGHFALAEPLAKLMGEAWAKWQTPVNLILPIPLHKKRQKDRGYNQSTLLAEHFARQQNLEVRKDILQRIKNTPPQVNLNAIGRQENMRQAFTVKTHNIVDQNILLIDDVCTTGATMASAAEVLLSAGAKSVSGYCVARAM
jgi:ComF family protein